MYSGIPAPQIDPVALQLGWLSIRWYSLAYIVGLVCAWLLARYMSRKTNNIFTIFKLDDFLSWATIGIILGGRLGYVFFYNLHYFVEFPLEIFAIWHGGMSFHGGLLGVIVAAVLFSHKKKIPLFCMSDMLVCVTPIGLFFGRLANFINGELYGRVTHAVPWAMVFDRGGREPRHPSQLYEALFEGVILFLILNALWWFCPRCRERRGYLTGLFFIFYAVFRFMLEFSREPDSHLGFVFFTLSMGQLLCLPMFFFGLWAILNSSPKTEINKVDDFKE